MKKLLSLFVLLVAASPALALNINWNGTYVGAGLGSRCSNNLPPHGAEVVIVIEGTNIVGQVISECVIINTLAGTVQGNVARGNFANGARFRFSLRSNKALYYLTGNAVGLCRAKYQAARLR